MPQVFLTAEAVADLAELIRTRSLPSSTGERVGRSLRALEQFPKVGAPVDQRLGAGRIAPRRFVQGPWRWMIVIYGYEETTDRVLVFAIVDGRTSDSPTANR